MEKNFSMTSGEMAAGQRQSWSLLEKLGEGDAGEVYLVESLLENKAAILKRPHRSAFSSDILRQAGQIKTEGQLLRALHNIFPPGDGFLHAPVLLDQSRSGQEFGEQLFIIIEKAQGFDLKSLNRLALFGQVSEVAVEGVPASQVRFLERLASQKRLPSLLLLRALSGVLEMFERAHRYEINGDGVRHFGIVWNDVKPEHLFWDPAAAKLTVIDWGNGQFLDAEGRARDLRCSRGDDLAQFVEEMGRFLAEAHPGLYEALEWPVVDSPTDDLSTLLLELKSRLDASLAIEAQALRAARRKEADLASISTPSARHLTDLDEVQLRILDFGELPDGKAALNLHVHFVQRLAAAQDLPAFTHLCRRAAALPEAPAEKWGILIDLSDEAAKAGELAQEAYLRALGHGVVDDWPSALWNLLPVVVDDTLPAWWDEIARRARVFYFQLEPESGLPYVAVSRLFFTFQSTVLNQREKHSREPASREAGDALRQLDHYTDLARMMDEEIVKKWKEVEPAPPNSGLEYTGLDELLQEIENLLPDAAQGLRIALTQPAAQAGLVIDAWRRKDFEAARRGLRNLLLWDPHRRRVWMAERALMAAPRWLLKVRQGARGDEPFQEYLTEVQLSGREFRNQVGSAPWLDSILEALKQLRNGARPADITMQNPELLVEIPWLNEYRSRETLTLPGLHKLSVERQQNIPAPQRMISGVVEAGLGQEQDVFLTEPLDGWAPEARGSSARVFNGYLQSSTGQKAEFAIKVMRPGSAEYSLPLFREEVQILTLLRDLPGVARMVECGFIRLADGLQIPPDDRRHTAAGLSGEVVRYGQDEIQSFLSVIDGQAGRGWLPYLALEKLDNAHNLMIYCDAGYTRGSFLPIKEALLIALQICDMLQIIHDRKVVYRDHKILHYYWVPATHGVGMIDWNISRRFPAGLNDADRRFDLVQFGARALHHILTGRAAPGSLPLGPNRLDEVDNAARSYDVKWTYDDERLPNSLKDILAEVLSGGYTYVKDLRRDLNQVFSQIAENSQPSP
jgi:serine/threonine protein kinase